MLISVAQSLFCVAPKELNKVTELYREIRAINLILRQVL